MDYDKAMSIFKREGVRVNGLSLTIEAGKIDKSYPEDVAEAIRYMTDQKGFERV